MIDRAGVIQCDNGYKIDIADATESEKTTFQKFLEHVYKHKHVAVDRANKINSALTTLTE
jgi:hypothetical protein